MSHRTHTQSMDSVVVPGGSITTPSDTTTLISTPGFVAGHLTGGHTDDNSCEIGASADCGLSPPWHWSCGSAVSARCLPRHHERTALRVHSRRRHGASVPLVPGTWFTRTELFFGCLASLDGSVSVGGALLGFLTAEITPRFPNGLTLLTGLGQFLTAQGVMQVKKSLLDC